MARILPGINIQWPISQLITEGKKTVETRTYPLPSKYLGKDLLLIETPGQSGRFRARIVGIIRFDSCFRYESKDKFYRDSKRHQVTADSEWAWRDDKGKYGWVVGKFQKFKQSKPAPVRRGIRFTTEVSY